MVGTVINPFLYVLVRASVRRNLTSYLKTLLQPFNFCRRRRTNNVALGTSTVRISACDLTIIMHVKINFIIFFVNKGRVLHRKDFRQGGNATVTPKSMKRAVPSKY